MQDTPVHKEELAIYLNASEIVQQGIMWLDKDGNILGINSYFAEELGYSRNDLERKTIFQINPHTTLLEWRKLWQKLVAERQVNIDAEHMTAKGNIFPIRMRGVLLELGDEKYCCGIIENLLSADRYHDLLKLTESISRTGSWEWDLLHNEVIISHGLSELTGLPIIETLSKQQALDILLDKLYPEELKMLKSRLEKAIKTGEPFEMELAVKTGKNDSVTRMNLVAKPVHQHNNTHKICGTLQDLSNIVARTEQLYLTQYCVDNTTQLIYWLQPDGRFIYANRAFCEKLGYTSTELQSMRLTDIEPNLTEEDWKNRWNQLKMKGVIEMEAFRQTKFGETIPVRLHLNYLTYNGEEYNLAFASDLRKKKKIEEDLKLSFATINQSTDMIFWLNNDGSFYFFNETFSKKTGYSPEEIKNMNLLDFFPEHDSSAFASGWKKLQSGQILSSELEITCKNGKNIFVESIVKMMKFGGKEYSSTVLRDIGKRKAQEKELKNRLREIETLRRQLEEENVILKEEIQVEQGSTNIISRSPNYKKVLRQVSQVADTNATVLILGETGTGKELIAKAIHSLSRRNDRSMIKVNCSALPENLIESELFGHEKGAFTGAYQRKVGRFELAHNGTIFLDEIGELPLDLQAKLLRVLQEGEFERLGSTETMKVDVRVIAATNRNLEKRVANGKFREDLFYRLNVFPIFNIPLRERKEDIQPLVRHFIEKYNHKLGKQIEEIPHAVLKELEEYEFPGNVRELENLIERAAILSPGKKLIANFQFKKTNSGAKTVFKTMDDMQREHILDALRRSNGKITGKDSAASLLGMNDKTLYSRMQKLNIERHDYLS